MRRLRLPIIWASLLSGLALGAISSFGALGITQLAGFGSGSGDPEFSTWVARVTAAGGTFAGDSKTIAQALLAQLHTRSYNHKVVYLLPLLGSNLAAARVPLRDSLHVGIAGNTGFVDGDFSQAAGLQGNGSSKRLDSLIRPDQLGSGNNGGLGWWETNFTGAGNNEAMAGNDGSPDNRFSLTLGASSKTFVWGLVSSGGLVTVSNSDTNGDYYGQRSAINAREIWRNGTQLATSSSINSAGPANSETIDLGSANYNGTHYPWPGRCACAYLTDGTLTSGEIADLHTLLQDYLITPTGR